MNLWLVQHRRKVLQRKEWVARRTVREQAGTDFVWCPNSLRPSSACMGQCGHCSATRRTSACGESADDLGVTNRRYELNPTALAPTGGHGNITW